MSEEEKKNTSLIIAPNAGLAKVSRLLQVTDKIIARSHQRAFELERAHFDTVMIGGQEWMTKNLDVAHFRNGDPIPEIRDNDEWKQAVLDGKPAWCYYENDPENGRVFGKLYNYHATTDARGLIPEGWRWPAPEDWIKLELEVWPPTLYNNSANLWYRKVDDDVIVKPTKGTYLRPAKEVPPVADTLQNAGFNKVKCGERDYHGYFDANYCTPWWWNIGMRLTFYIGDRDELYRREGNLFWHRADRRPYLSGGIKCVRDTKFER